jgi:endoglucanase
MDHPGFSVAVAGGSGNGSRKSVQAHLLGGVDRKYLRGGRVRFFGPAGEVVGTIISHRKPRQGAAAPWLLCRICLERAADLPAGTIGMWDFPALAFRGRRLLCRACDDVIGSAAVLCAMDEIVRRRLPARVTVLLTRAEEEGFIGALAACRDGRLPRGASLVAVEASREQPGAAPGDGVVVRVGDRSRTFDPTLTAHVSAVAADLVRRAKGFRYVRQLMPGGTCESTAYLLWGHAATGLCLPLVNYHNMGPAGRVAAEQVDTRDFDCLVQLMVALAADDRRPGDVDKALRSRLRLLLKSREGFLGHGFLGR